MPYAKDLDIVVFNGTACIPPSCYDVDGVKYLLLGGGGAEQDPILPGRTHIKLPKGYPPDQYWKGEAPKEDYNYVLVDVQPGQKNVVLRSIASGRGRRNRSRRSSCSSKPRTVARRPRMRLTASAAFNPNSWDG